MVTFLPQPSPLEPGNIFVMDLRDGKLMSLKSETAKSIIMIGEEDNVLNLIHHKMTHTLKHSQLTKLTDADFILLARF